MALPIVIPANNSPIFTSSPADSVNWTFTPNTFYIPWIMGTATPVAFTIGVRYPAYTTFEQFENYTDWLFETSVVNSGSVPLAKVNGEFIGSGNLGLLGGFGFYTKILNFTFVNLNVLSGGVYAGTVTLTITARNPSTGQRQEINSKQYFFQFEVRPSYPVVPLQITYPGDGIDSDGNRNPLVFIYQNGSELPQSQNIHCFPGRDDITVESDVPLETTVIDATENYKLVKVELGSVVLDADPGEYPYILTITANDGINSTTIEVEVILKVLGFELDAFLIDPEDLIFNVVSGSSTPTQRLRIFSIGTWSIIGDVPDWLHFTSYGASASSNTYVSVVNYNGFLPGTYTSVITFDNNGTIITIPVTMNLLSFLETPFITDSIYFTEELDYLFFDSELSNTFIEITVSVTSFKVNSNTADNYSRVYNLPLFQNKGRFHVGTVVHQLLEEIQFLYDYVPDTETNYAKPQLQPVEVDITFQEKSYVPIEDESALTNGVLQKFKMIKGSKPFLTQGQLALLTVSQQELTRITPNSVVGVSFLHFGTPRILVLKNGNIIEDFSLASFSGSGIQKVVYSYYRFANDFSPGDIVEIMILNGLETRSQRFIVFRSGLESTFFFFENSNGQIEPFEFSGRRRVISNIKHVSTSKFKDLHGFEAKVSASNSQSLIVNTGQLTKTEHKIVTEILKSENVWCSFDHSSGPYLKIDSTTTKLTNQDTSVNEEGFDIEFNILENADVTIYPQ